MSYNSGKSLNIEEITDIEKAIDDFSEGNIYLKRLLLECYVNNIKTNACCAGHEEIEQFPYISFQYLPENEQIFYYLLLNLKDSGTMFGFNKSNSASWFTIEFTDYEPKCFQIILELIQSFDKTKDYYVYLPQDLQEYFSILKTINSYNLLNVSNSKSSSYFQFYYMKDADTYNYWLHSNNYDCIYSMLQAGFKSGGEDMYDGFYIDSKNREDNNLVLQRLKKILDSKIEKKSNSTVAKK